MNVTEGSGFVGGLYFNQSVIVEMLQISQPVFFLFINRGIFSQQKRLTSLIP